MEQTHLKPSTRKLEPWVVPYGAIVSSISSYFVHPSVMFLSFPTVRILHQHSIYRAYQVVDMPFPKPSLEIICNPSKRYTLDCYCIHENNICCKCSIIPRSSYLVEQITYPFSCGSILVAYQFETNAIRNPSVISDVCGCDITQYV
jgi:hypothetical protein